MTGVVDATERRARRRRLAIILAVVGVLLVGALVWRRTTEHAVDAKTETAKTELRRLWRDVDLVAMQREYSNEATDASSTGNYDQAFAVIPQPEHAKTFLLGFGRGGVVEASYNVTAGLGGRRCLQMRVVGPAPNRVAFQEHRGQC